MLNILKYCLLKLLKMGKKESQLFLQIGFILHLFTLIFKNNLLSTKSDDDRRSLTTKET